MASSREWFETVAEAQRRARKRLPKSVYMALVAGSERGLTANDNVDAFAELGFRPRIADLPQHAREQLPIARLFHDHDAGRRRQHSDQEQRHGNLSLPDDHDPLTRSLPARPPSGSDASRPPQIPADSGILPLRSALARQAT